MSIKNWINRKMKKYFSKKFIKKEWVSLDKDLKRVFNSMGDNGVWIAIIRRHKLKNKLLDFIVGIIAKICDNNVHAVPVFFTSKSYMLHELLSPLSMRTLRLKLDKYYKNPPNTTEVEAWVMGSAEEDGMNYFDFSAYAGRKFSLFHIPINSLNYKLSAIDWFINKHKAPYDSTGLLFWYIYKKLRFLNPVFDDAKSYFCSEIVYDGFKKIGCIVSKKDNPSPDDIYNYLKEQGFLVYENF